MEDRPRETGEEATSDPGAGLAGARIPAALIGGALALLAVLVQADAAFEFRSDDVTLVAQGMETSILGGLLRSFARPFADLGTIAFYRPLFSFDFGALGRLFGDDPRPHGWINLLLQALTVLLGHRCLLRLGFGARAAAFGTLLFALQPWAVNNVAWLVGRSTTVATLGILGVFLLDRRALDRGRTFSWAAAILLLACVFYRETAAFALVLIGLADRCDSRPWAQSLRRLLPLVLVMAIPLGLRLVIIGDLVGGYGALSDLRGDGSGPGLAETGPAALYRLIGAAPGTIAASLGWRTHVGAILAILGLLLAPFGRGRSGRAAIALFVLVVLHGLPLLTVDAEVQAGTSQRWHSVLWALSALIGLGVARLDLRLGLPLVLIIASLWGWRLRDDLDDYERSAEALRSLRAAIARSAEPIILAHGMVPYIGCAPFLEIGAGQLCLPPFADGSKALYPLMSVAAHGPDARRMQTPLAPALAEAGENISPLWLDPDSLEVIDMPLEEVRAAGLLFASRQRLDLTSPRPGDAAILLDVDVNGAERIEIHFVTPLAELRLVRRRGEGAFAGDAERLVEDLAALSEIGRHLDGAARGRCFFWVTAHSDRRAVIEPFAVSEIIPIQLEEGRR